MRAAVLRGPEVLRVEQLPDPPVPKGGMLVKVYACGICGSDLRSYRFGLKVDLPWQVPGHEVAGEVIAVGEDVTGWQVGDRVALAADVTCGECAYCRRGYPNLCEKHRVLGVHLQGGMAEVLKLDEEILHHGIVHRIPDGLDYDAAAMAEPASSVMAAQEDVGVAAGETVVVIGAGPMGTLHAELAMAKGAQVFLLDLAEDRLEAAREIVPEARMIHTASEDPMEVVRAATGGLGADVAISAAPTAAAVNQAIDIVCKRGRVVVFGGLPKDRSGVTINANRLHYDEILVRGAFSYRPKHHAQALDYIACGRIKAHKYITHRLPLDRVEEGFKLLAAGKAMKVIIKPN